jgi:uncharacterized protein YqgQ
MNKEERLINYRIAVLMFNRWFEEGVISKKEFLDAEDVIAQKYGLTKTSIYRKMTCY